MHRHLGRLAISNDRISKNLKASSIGGDEDEKPVLKSKDVFGTLSPPEVLSSDLSVEDDDDGYDKMERMKRRRPLKSYDWIFHSLKHNGGPNKVKRAVEFYLQMKHEDNYLPEKHHYTLLISSCAEFGLTDKAFYFFDELIKSGRKPTRATVTSLINSCAESRDKKVAKEKLSEIISFINDHSYIMNQTQFNVLVKAYARLGDYKRAFEIMRIMSTEGVEPNAETFSMLLMACISDRTSGCSHAIRIMREIKKRNLLDVHHYNLFVRCIRDCGFGSANHLNHLLREVTVFSDSQSLANTVSQQEQLDQSLPSSAVNLLSLENPSPSVALDFPILEAQISLLNESREKRLMAVGGVMGLLSDMKENNVTPTAATLTTLLSSIPSNNKTEEELVREATKLGVKFDTDFFNMVIKKRGKRRDINAAKQVLLWMQERHLPVDIVTFGVLALACTNRHESMQLLTDMKDCGFSPNLEIFGVLVDKACKRQDCSFVVFLLQEMESKGVKPDPKLLQVLEKFKNICHNHLINHERQGTTRENVTHMQRGFDEFKLFYKTWLKRVKVEVPRREEEQFDFKIPENPRHKMFLFEKEMRQKIKERREG